MISSDRTQNIIVAGMIVATIISSVFLVNNAMYYSGSYSLVGRLDVTMNAPVVANVDPTNESIFPSISLSFHLVSQSTLEGNVRITFIGADVRLNDDMLSYTPFAWTVPLAEQHLTPGYNRTVVLSRSTYTEEDAIDRQTILTAYDLGVWNWTVVLRYSFIVFDEPGSISWVYIPFSTVDVVLA
jgi:hypothetical protein